MRWIWRDRLERRFGTRSSDRMRSDRRGVYVSTTPCGTRELLQA